MIAGGWVGACLSCVPLTVTNSMQFCATGVGMKIASEGPFEAVARTICGDPVPQWLPVALGHYAVWIDGDDASDLRPEVKKRLEQMQEAIRVLENSLPIWEHMPFEIKCPPAVKTILEALPGLKAEIAKLNRPYIGRRPDAQREICAAVIIEAWRIVHGRVEARSERLYEACNQYWTECGGAPVGPKGDIENWRRTVDRAIKSDHQWIRDQMAWILSKKWTDQKPHGDVSDDAGGLGGPVQNSA